MNQEIIDYFKNLFGIESKDTVYINGKPTVVSRKGNKLLIPVDTYRNHPGQLYKLGNKHYTIGRQRVNQNVSPTKKESERIEHFMNREIGKRGTKSDPNYDLPFINEKAIVINGNVLSTNMLDSIAKYTGIHNANPILAEYPLKSKKTGKSLGTPRRISIEEAIGLPLNETNGGAQPRVLIDKSSNPRAVSNANYAKAFGYIAPEYFINNYHYTDTPVNKNTEALLDGLRYYAEGDYNRNDKNHTKKVQTKGSQAFTNPDVKQWYNSTGKIWYNKGVTIGKQRTRKTNGGSIHIAHSKRGTFTAAATKHGMGVQEFASRVLRNKDSYSPAMVKKANFARNASKWNH